MSEIIKLFWISLIAYTCFQGLTLTGILPRRKRVKNQQNHLLTAMIVICVIITGIELIDKTIGFESAPHLIFLSLPFWYLLPPSIYLFIRKQVKGVNLTPFDILHLLPALGMSLYMLEFYLLPAHIKLIVLENIRTTSKPEFSLELLFQLSQSCLYLVMNIALLRMAISQHVNLNHTKWLTVLVIVSGVTTIACLTTFIAGLMNFSTTWWAGHLFYLAPLLFLVSVLSFMVTSPHVVLNETFIKKPRLSNVDPMYMQLLDFIDKEKPFTDPNYSIEMLAKQLKTSRNHIQHILKSHSGKNFRDFMNYRRLQEAKKRLTEPNNSLYTIESIARDAGFNSPATFYRVFKKIEGKTPKMFLN